MLRVPNAADWILSILTIQKYEVYLGRDQKLPKARNIIALNKPEAISVPICNPVNTGEPAPNTTAPSLRQKPDATSAMYTNLIIIVFLQNIH